VCTAAYCEVTNAGAEAAVADAGAVGTGVGVAIAGSRRAAVSKVAVPGKLAGTVKPETVGTALTTGYGPD